MAALISSKVWFLFIALTVQYNTITLFKEGSAITCYSFLTYGPQKKKKKIDNPTTDLLESVDCLLRDCVLYSVTNAD